MAKNMKLIGLLALIIVSSCSAEAQSPRKIKRQERRLVRHTRQAEYHARKASLEFCTTVKKADTVIVPMERVDTLFSFTNTNTNTHDTIHYETERIYLKTIINRIDSTIILQAECKEQAIINTEATEQVSKPMNTIDTNTIIKEPTWWINVKSYWWIALVIIGVVLLIKGLKKVGI